MVAYSILLNVYLSKENENVNYDKYTFTIVKSIKDEKENGTTVKVKLLFDLIQECKNEEEKQKLLQDNQKIVQIVTGKRLL